MSDRVNNVYILNPDGKSLDADVFMQCARNAKLQDVLVLGWKENGDFYIGANFTRLAEVVWLLANAQRWVDRYINAEEAS